MTDMEEELGTGSETNENQEQHAESWKEEIPQDDFHDRDQEELEEIETEEPPPSSSSETASAAKKAGNKVMLATLAGVVLVIGGMVYMQYGGKSATKAPLAIPADVLESGAPSSAEVKKEQRPEVVGLGATPTTAEMDVSALYNAGMERTVAPTTNAAVVPGTSSEIVTTTPIAPQVTPGEAMVVAPAPVQTEKKAELAPVATETRLNELSVQVEELKKTLQETARQTSQIVQRLDALQPSFTPGGITLESRLEQLEQKLAKEPEKKAVKAARETDAYAAEEVKQPVKRAAKKAPKTKEKAGKWVLRAATPEAAWVSKGAGTAELQQVQIGDTLPGIGKVQEIRQTGDKWTVVGTKGTIH